MSSSSRLHQINERLKVICPDNDDGQYDHMITQLEEALYYEVFGCDRKTADEKFQNGIAELSRQRLDIVGKLVAGLQMPPIDPIPDGSAAETIDHVAPILSQKLHNLMVQYRFDLERLEQRRESLVDDFAEGRCQIADELFVRMGRLWPSEVADKKYGAAEHRVEVAALKDERRRLLSQ
jgi:hypothetical protein